MKNFILAVVLLMTVIDVFGQDKKLEAIKKLYDNQSFAECIEASKKYNVANKQQPDGYFYLGFSYYFQWKNTPQKEYLLSQAENTVFMAMSKDKDSTARKKFSGEIDSLYNTVLTYQNKFWDAGDKNKAGQHAEMLAKIWNDTTEIYKRIKMPELFVKPITQGKQLAQWEGPENQTDVAGNKVGVWIERYPNGKRKTQINYDAGKPRGDYYRFYEKGGVSAHLYMIDNDHASAILYDEIGDKVAMGYYYKRQKDSLWQYLTMDSILIAEENWTRGVKNGVETTYYLWGLVANEVTWKNGVKDGPWKRYHESGEVHIDANYKDGKLCGSFKQYDIQGNLQLEGNYKDDLKEGEWKIFDNETKKFTIKNYIKGKSENAEEEEKEETQKMLNQMEKAKSLDDPKDFMHNPEEYFQRR